MEKRSTAHMMEPELYAIYMLVLKHGMSPHRALTLWKETTSYNSGRNTIKQIIRWQLERYWKMHGFTTVGDNLTDPESTISFLKRYVHKPRFLRRIFGRAT